MKILKFSQILVIVCLSLIFYRLTLSSQPQWRSKDSEPFRIYFLDSDKIYTEQIASLLNISYLEIASKFGLKLTETVSVFICPTDAIFTDLTGHLVPDWGEGIADPVQNIIIIKSPGLTENERHLPKLIKHELVHILFGSAVEHPEKLPKWFNEGLASYLSADEQIAPGKAISKALLSNSIIPLDEIDNVLKFQLAKATLAYEESYSFMEYLIKTYGLPKIAHLINELKGENSFEHAFQNVYEIDLFEAELNWYNYIEKKYRWSFLLDFDTYLWIFILILFTLVFVAIKLRNRKTIKNWEEEERLANS